MRSAVSLSMLLLALAAPAAAQQATDASAQPLSIEQALDLAERASESVGLARSGLAQAQGERQRARSGYFPQLTGSASYTRTLRSQFSALQDNGLDAPVPEECSAFVPRPGLPIEERLDSLEAALECASNADPFAGLADDLPFGRENTYRLGLSFSQTLFTEGGSSGQAQAAEASVRSARLGLTSAQAQLLLDVTEAYYDAALGDRLVVIAQASLEQADTTLSQTQLARQVGNQSEFDLLRARVTRDNQRPVVIQRQAARDIAYYRLKNLLNLPPEAPLELTSELVDTGLVRTARLAELVETPGDTTADAQGAGAPGGRGGHLSGGTSPRGAGAALASGVAHLGLRRIRLSGRRLAVQLRLPLRLGGSARFPGSLFHRRSDHGRRRRGRAGLEQARLRLRQTRELAQLDARNTQLQLAAAALPGRRAPAPKSRPIAPTRSRRSATARASRPRPSSTTFASSWPRPKPIGPRRHATSRWRACGSRCCPRSRWVPPRAAPKPPPPRRPSTRLAARPAAVRRHPISRPGRRRRASFPASNPVEWSGHDPAAASGGHGGRSCSRRLQPRRGCQCHGERYSGDGRDGRPRKRRHCQPGGAPERTHHLGLAGAGAAGHGEIRGQWVGAPDIRGSRRAREARPAPRQPR